MGNKITTREGFISDNLVNIGKRLQINHDLQNAAENPGETSLPAEKLAVRRAALDRSEAERLQRELRDRIGHEAAAVNAELESMTERREELERFRDFLTEAAAGVEQVDAVADDAIRKLGDIRYRFFTASGRAQAFFGLRGNAPTVAESSDFERRPRGVIWRESAPIVLALLVAALLVGAAVIYSLH